MLIAVSKSSPELLVWDFFQDPIMASWIFFHHNLGSESFEKIGTIFFYLKEARPEWNNCDDEWKNLEYAASAAFVLSLFEISPTVVADVELETSQGLHLAKWMEISMTNQLLTNVLSQTLTNLMTAPPTLVAPSRPSSLAKTSQQIPPPP